jgi:hypothetical protein
LVVLLYNSSNNRRVSGAILLYRQPSFISTVRSTVFIAFTVATTVATVQYIAVLLLGCSSLQQQQQQEGQWGHPAVPTTVFHFYCQINRLYRFYPHSTQAHHITSQHDVYRYYWTCQIINSSIPSSPAQPTSSTHTARIIPPNSEFARSMRRCRRGQT